MRKDIVINFVMYEHSGHYFCYGMHVDAQGCNYFLAKAHLKVYGELQIYYSHFASKTYFKTDLNTKII